jgi:hypothetical protein
MDFNSTSGFMPRNNPANTEAIRNDKKGFNFFAVRKICNAMARMRISIGIDGYFQEDLPG